jgi:GTP cyclohydrolase II
MSKDKFEAILGAGIEVLERVDIPEALIPADARVEIDAKLAAGYFSARPAPEAEQLRQTRGRGLD